jgi:hypothetical protein
MRIPCIRPIALVTTLTGPDIGAAAFDSESISDRETGTLPTFFEQEET